MEVKLEKIKIIDTDRKEKIFLYITTTAPDGTHKRYLYSSYVRSLIDNKWTTSGAAAFLDRPDHPRGGIVIAKKVIRI